METQKSAVSCLGSCDRKCKWPGLSSSAEKLEGSSNCTGVGVHGDLRRTRPVASVKVKCQMMTMLMCQYSDFSLIILIT